MFSYSLTSLKFIFLLSLFNVCFSTKVCYDRYTVLRITPCTESQLKSLCVLHDKHVGDVEYWLPTSAVNKSADVMVKPSFKKTFIRQLNSLHIPYKTLIADVGKKIKEDEITPAQRAQLGFFEAYQSYEEIQLFFQDLVYKFPECLSLTTIGVSYEGRPLQVLRITANPYERKPAIWIHGGTHAREFIGPSTVTYIANELSCLCHKPNEEAYKLLSCFDWYILPILNPDGYEYAQNVDRLWRKTRSCHPNVKNCVGVDANRNWDIKWSDATGASLRCCSDYYAGPSAFSEPETRAVANFMLENLKDRMLLFIDFHSYSQRWSTPYGYTAKLPANYPEQKRLAEVAIRALRKVNGTRYTTGSTDKITYTVSGGARDWVYDEICPKYAYVVELRDKGQYGFVLPRCLIVPTGKETWEGVKCMALDLTKNLHLDSYLV